MTLRSYNLIQSYKQWTQCIDALCQEERFALDIEANSLYAYHERICLIQITIPSADYIIDPFADVDLDMLGELIANKNQEKILHSAEYDIILMKGQYGWELHNLFDTMWAARILGYEKIGLANILRQHFNVQLDKSHQTANWCHRPLSQAELVYAQKDTHYLPALRQILSEQLQAKDHWQEAQEIFQEQCLIDPPDKEFNIDHFWRLQGVQHLTGQQKAVAKALYAYRDSEACQQDIPLFRVFSNETLVALAKEIPANKSALNHIKGLYPQQIRKYGKDILKTIQDAKEHPIPKRPPRTKRLNPQITERFEKLHIWRKMRAQQRGVESDVILNRQTLWELARQVPTTLEELQQIESLGECRQKMYGAELIQLLQEIK